jgi:hypothetical protein
MAVITLPDIMPSRISGRLPANHAVFRFVSDAGLDTRVCVGCGGHGASMTIEYKALKSMERAYLLRWWAQIGGSDQGSCKAFLIPDCHSAIALIPEWAVYREQLQYDADGRAWWIAKSRKAFDGDLCQLLDWEIEVENVFRRI